MIPIKLTLENFESHARSTLDFTKFDVAVIIGTFVGNPYISNGSGKSSIFDAIRWVLFNKTRLSSVDKVIKWGKSGCTVEFIFDLYGDRYRITRKKSRRSTTSVLIFEKYVDGSWTSKGYTGDTPTSTNRKIVEVLGFSHDTFVNSVYLGQFDFARFVNATANKRKDTLKEILRIGIWDEFQKRAKFKKDNIEKQVDSLKERIDSIGNLEIDIKSYEKKLLSISGDIQKEKIALSNLEECKSKYSEEILTLERELSKSGNESGNRIKERLNVLVEKAKSMRISRSDIKEKIKKNNIAISNADRDCVNLENSIVSFAKDILNISSHSKKQQAESIIIKSKHKSLIPKFDVKEFEEKRIKKYKHQRILDVYRVQLKQLNKLEPGEECPVCITIIDNPEEMMVRRRDREKFLISKIEKEKSIITTLNKELNSYQEAVDAANNAALEIERTNLIIAKRMSDMSDSIRSNEALQEKLKSMSEELNSMKEERSRLLGLMGNMRTADNSEKEVDKLTSKMIDLSKQIEYTNKSIIELSVKEGSVKGYREDLKRRMMEKSVLKEQYDKFSQKLHIFTKLTNSFGKNGIQAIIMENITEDLREYTNNILKKICNEIMTVNFITQKQTGKGGWKEDFSIKVSMDSIVLDFDDLSGGEQVRVAFAIRLALSRLLMRRVGSNVKFLLMDEIDMPLDRFGVETLADSIKALASEFKILVITHNDYMKEKFDQIITVQKGPGGSSVKQ